MKTSTTWNLLCTHCMHMHPPEKKTKRTFVPACRGISPGPRTSRGKRSRCGRIVLVGDFKPGIGRPVRQRAGGWRERTGDCSDSGHEIVCFKMKGDVYLNALALTWRGGNHLSVRPCIASVCTVLGCKSRLRRPLVNLHAYRVVCTMGIKIKKKRCSTAY